MILISTNQAAALDVPIPLRNTSLHTLCAGEVHLPWVSHVSWEDYHQEGSGDDTHTFPSRSISHAVLQQVVDSNPYSRLMALKRMGIVAEYERIRDFSVIIVGLGGIGR